MEFIEKNCREFTDQLASKAPVPGGGGTSALVGSMGVALGSMVGQLTIGKKKYAEVEADIKKLMKEAEQLRYELLQLVEEDAVVFTPLAEAYGLPSNTEEAEKAKREIMESALKNACSVPLEIMRKCCQGIKLQEDFAKKGSAMAISDAGVGVIFCKAALQGASLNVFINTKSMTDRKYADKINFEAEKMLAEYTIRADKVFDGVFDRLK